MPASLLTVVTPAASRLLCAVADVAAELEIAADARLTAEVASASAAAEAWCGRRFVVEGLSEVFRLEAGEQAVELALSRWPVAAVSGVVENGAPLAPFEWECDAAAGLLYRLASDERVAWRARKIVVTYAAGFAPADIPADVQRAVRMIAAAGWQARGRDPRVRSEAAEGVGKISYLDSRAGAEALPLEAMGLLSPWRVVRT